MIKKGKEYEYIGEGGDNFLKGNIYLSHKDGYLISKNNYSCRIGTDFAKKCFVEIANKDNINPSHYQYNIKSTPCDLFDIGVAMDLNIEQFTALRYFRKKENPLEDTKKAIKCLQRLVERLENESGN